MLRRTLTFHTRVAFIGLGQMGGRMAQNVFKQVDVTELRLYDTSADNLNVVKDALSVNPVIECGNPQEAADTADIIVTMLPNAKIVDSVYNGENGIFSSVKAGALLIDASTIDPDTPKALAATAASKDVMFVDAPVSGGVNAAAAGTLTFIVGGSAEAFERAKTGILGVMGKSVLHCGDVGCGQVVKLCNNLILGQHMIAVSEAMLLGTKLGVSAETLAQVVNTSTGRCWSSELYNPYPGLLPNVPSSNGYQGGFGSALMLKDLGLAVEAAQKAGLKTPGGDNAKAVYTDVCVNGMAGLDFSSVLKYIEKL